MISDGWTDAGVVQLDRMSGTNFSHTQHGSTDGGNGGQGDRHDTGEEIVLSGNTTMMLFPVYPKNRGTHRSPGTGDRERRDGTSTTRKHVNGGDRRSKKFSKLQNEALKGCFDCVKKNR